MNENEIFRKKTIKFLEYNGVKLSDKQQKRLFSSGNREEIERIAKILVEAEYRNTNRDFKKDLEKIKKVWENISKK